MSSHSTRSASWPFPSATGAARRRPRMPRSARRAGRGGRAARDARLRRRQPVSRARRRLRRPVWDAPRANGWHARARRPARSTAWRGVARGRGARSSPSLARFLAGRGRASPHHGGSGTRGATRRGRHPRARRAGRARRSPRSHRADARRDRECRATASAWTSRPRRPGPGICSTPTGSIGSPRAARPRSRSRRCSTSSNRCCSTSSIAPSGCRPTNFRALRSRIEDRSLVFKLRVTGADVRARQKTLLHPGEKTS